MSPSSQPRSKDTFYRTHDIDVDQYADTTAALEVIEKLRRNLFMFQIFQAPRKMRREVRHVRRLCGAMKTDIEESSQGPDASLDDKLLHLLDLTLQAAANVISCTDRERWSHFGKLLRDDIYDRIEEIRPDTSLRTKISRWEIWKVLGLS